MPNSLRALTSASASASAHSPATGLFVATLSSDGKAAYRDDVWGHVFGEEDDVWARLARQDRHTAALRVAEAASGRVTNQLFLVGAPGTDQSAPRVGAPPSTDGGEIGHGDPLPVFLQFFPVYPPRKRRRGRTASAITVTGEVLALDDETVSAHLQRDRMEALGRMTMGITHDFNNLLSSIIGHTELVHETYTGSVPATILSEYLRAISQAALDGAALIQKIQRYIRREAEVRHEPLDLVSLIEGCLLLTRPYWYNEPRRRGISIDARITAPEGGVPLVMGTAHELREVVVNLILNAVGAMPEGGDLHLDVRCAEEQGAAVVVARITDTGTGMPERVLARIFEPLFTTKGDRGSGMGLAVAQGVIRKHSGSISAESEPGEGTTFTITLPAVDAYGGGEVHCGKPYDLSHEIGQAPAEDPMSGRGQAAEAHPVRVLIVDDEAAVRSVLARLLRTRGYTVEVADSAAAALALLTEMSPPDVLFTDQCMPEMDGRALARAVRARHEGLPIVLLSGDTDLGIEGEAIDVVLGKPFQLADLDAVIRQLTQKPEA